jgi:hypothetical protein
MTAGRAVIALGPSPPNLRFIVKLDTSQLSLGLFVAVGKRARIPLERGFAQQQQLLRHPQPLMTFSGSPTSSNDVALNRRSLAGLVARGRVDSTAPARGLSVPQVAVVRLV